MITRTENFDLSAHNTFRMKVRCALYLEYDKASDLLELDWESLPKPVMHIGGGSNLLFTSDFPGTVLHSEIDYIKYLDLGLDEVPVLCGSSVVFDRFVENTAGNGLWGAENLSLIPGEVGAAAVQNIGAYGVEVKDIIKGVVCFDTVERRSVKFTTAECGYGYRESMFKHAGGRYIITSVLFRLSRKPAPKLGYKGLEGVDGSSPMAVRKAVTDIRRSKLPDPSSIGSAGSFFKNPVIDPLSFTSFIDKAKALLGPDVSVPHFILDGGYVKVSAAWLIDKCGFKGKSEGGASVWEKQPLVIVNASGEAAPGDVLALEKSIIDGVRDRFGLELHPEVEHI